MTPRSFLAFAAAVVMLAPSASAQGVFDEPAREISVSFGVQVPADGLVRDLYGPHLPVTVQMDWLLTDRLAVFGGGRLVRSSGNTRVIDPAFDESYSLSLGTDGFRAGALLLFPRGAWRVSAGGGASFTRYRERWPDAGLTETGQAAGLLLQFGIGRTLSGPIGFIGRAEYEWIPAGYAEGPAADLGGVGASVGILFRF